MERIEETSKKSNGALRGSSALVMILDLMGSKDVLSEYDKLLKTPPARACLPLLLNNSMVAEQGLRERMIKAKRLLQNGSSFLKNRLPLCVLPLFPVENGQVAQRPSSMGVIGAYHLAIDRESLLVVITNFR